MKLREIYGVVGIVASLLPASLGAQSFAPDPDGFGTLPALNKQAQVSGYEQPEMVGMEPAAAYRRGQAGRIVEATGMLDLILANGKRAFCTGVLIDAMTVLTNEHCFPTDEAGGRVVQAYFFLGYLEADRKSDAERLRVDPLPLERQTSPLDYAIVRLLDAPLRARPVTFSIRDPDANEPLWMVGHPRGWPMLASRGLCRTASNPLDLQSINHLCNTYGGSSGSMIFSDAERGVAVALHTSGAERKGRPNRGTRLTQIAAVSPILSRISGVSLRNPVVEFDVTVASPIEKLAACDRVAAHPYNPDNPTSVIGVTWEDLNADQAITICEAAANVMADHQRVQFQLARAYKKAGRAEESVTLFMNGESANYAAAIANLAISYEYSSGVDKDLDRAFDLYERAANLGHAVSSLKLGTWFRDAKTGDTNYSLAMSWFEKARRQGHAEASGYIGHLFQKGFGVPKNIPAAIENYEIAAARDISWAQRNLAWLLAYGPRDLRNYQKAFELYQRVHANGEVKVSSANLGNFYERGWYVEKDIQIAETYYQAAVDAGNVGSLADLGDLHRDKTPANFQTALGYYERAIEAGHESAIARIAYLYDREYLTAGDEAATAAKAHELYLAAAQNGVGWAMRQVGDAYRWGGAVGQNYETAISWYEAAIAESDDDWAMFELGEMLVKGQGTPVNGLRARALFEAAYDKGNDRAGGHLANLLGTTFPSDFFPISSDADDDTVVVERGSYHDESTNRILAWAQALGFRSEIPEHIWRTNTGRLSVIASLPNRNELYGQNNQAVFVAEAKARQVLSQMIADGANTNDLMSQGISIPMGPGDAMMVMLLGNSNPKVSTQETYDLRKALVGRYARQQVGWDDGSISATSEASIMNLQRHLQNLGYKTGRIDGDFGTTTRRAMQAFLSDYDLEAASVPTKLALYGAQLANFILQPIEDW